MEQEKLLDVDSNSDSGDEDVKTKGSLASNKIKFGAFQSMGLSPGILKGVMRRGYRLATPIQRKAIPHILAGRDIVGMSRTGSGKTAAFLVPMFEKLRAHLLGSGPRALIISPSRDLALQTAGFVKELGKYTDLRTAVIIGGDRLEDQFTLLHSEPDILIVTPGRLLHVLVEMELKLSSIIYLVFDEADRLFELGFSSQVSEILSRTSVDRQTLLFSATLPSAVAEFVAAGLHNPKLVRLDVDTKISPQLTLRHFLVSPSDKLNVLLHLLKNINKSAGFTENQTRQASCVVFVATRYHVDYIYHILTRCGISATYAYSSMDPTARKINMAKFRMNQANVLVVTDVAARGIDIPELDIVVNFNFPSKPKLFIHRVGRVARAGRCGVAYSLISSDEVPYLVDLNLFLGKPVKLSMHQDGEKSSLKDDNAASAVELGSCPRSFIDRCSDIISKTNMTDDPEVEQMVKAVHNAMAKYLRLRPPPSPEAVKQSKKLIAEGFPPVHSMFAGNASASEDMFFDRIRKYKPKEAFVALTSVKTKQICNQMAKVKESKLKRKVPLPSNAEKESDLVAQTAPISDTTVAQSLNSGPPVKKHRSEKSASGNKSEFFVPYVPTNQRLDSEFRLSTMTSDSMAAATLDIADDERLNTRRSLQGSGDKRLIHVWHRQAKKFVTIDLATKRDGTVCREKSATTGRWIPKTFKSKKYEDWKRSNLNAVEADGTTATNRKGLLTVTKRPDWRNKRKGKRDFKKVGGGSKEGQKHSSNNNRKNQKKIFKKH